MFAFGLDRAGLRQGVGVAGGAMLTGWGNTSLRGTGLQMGARSAGGAGYESGVVGRGGSSAQQSPVEALPVLHLLVLDDDPPVREACLEIAQRMGFAVIGAGTAAEARALLKHQKIDVLLMDMRLPGGGGLPLLEEIKTLFPETGVIVMTAFATVSSAVEAMRIGAGDYLTKPFALEELTAILGRAGERRQFDLESRRLRERMRNQRGVGHLIGRSPEMEKLYRILSKVAHTTHPVLIVGESGTGKELVARTIHFNGPNAQKPFVPVDCASLVPSLIESELFGYVKGAFPGAQRNKDGLLATAEGGTVFLDEVGELPLELQAKLLRALQEREIRPMGSLQTVPITVRLLASTSQDLPTMVEAGRFRKDLYFRLNVVSLRLPPLRERKDDIPLLVQHFLDRYQRETGKGHTFSDDALRSLAGFEWPGNVRELEHAIERACALSSGPVLHLGDLPTQLQEFRMQRRVLESEEGGTGGEVKIVSMAEVEKDTILGTIRHLHGDKLMAAKLLGIGKTTLYRKLKEYGMEEE